MNFYQHTAQAHSNHHAHYHITSQEPDSDDNEALELNFPSQRPGANLHIAYDLDSNQRSLHFSNTARSSLPLILASSSSQSQPTISTSLDPAEERKLVEEATCTSYLKLYQHRALKTRISESKTWEIQCPDQGCWVKTGIRTHIELTTRGQFMALEKHHGSRTCGPKRTLQKTVQASMQISRLTLTTAFRPTQVSQNSSSDLESLTLVKSASCPGLALHDWPMQPGLPVGANFPWLRTREGPDQLPFTVNLIDSVLYARSPICTHDADGEPSCIPCRQLQPRINSLAQLAKDRNHYTRHGILTPVQLLEVITERNTSVNSLKLQSLNDDRKIKRLLSQLEDHTSLVMALSQCDVPWLRNLLQTALKNGASVRMILRLIEDAIERGYRPRGHSKDSIDLAILIHHLGGRNLLYAMSQRLPIPSLRTLSRHASFIKIAPVIGCITVAVIQQNIESVVLATLSPTETRLRGVSLLIDETAQEEAAVFLPQSNCVGGLCWTHANLVDVSLNNYQSALNIAAALKSGKVHLGKEITVVGAHIFGEEGLYPILAAPTCKSEGAPEMEFVFNTIIEAWSSSDAANRVGPVWSVATDGDATRRKAGHKTFVRTPLTVTSPLYGILSNLPGLNLLTGDQAVTLDFDYKHIYKRISTLMRSRSGMFLNNGRCINTSMLQRYLVWIDGIDEARAQKLLYPDDPQDVPRAVELMSAVIKLAAVDPTKPPFTPLGAQASVDLIADFDAIRLLGTLIHHILDPFINVSLSLSEQVVHLSCFSHLLYACYRSQRRALMPNQLYYDMQTLTKNAIFCIAKQQKLDASASFSLLDLGDDALELQFAFLRMCGGHNSAVTYRQALDRLGAARDIGGVYARNPDLAHGHRRLNLKRADGVDHISRSMWVGDTVTGHCDLPHSWREGRDKAIDILKHSQISRSCYEFNTLFAHNSGVDLLCVFGEGKYPSVDDNDEEDRSLLAPTTQVSQDVHCDIPTADSVQQSSAAAEDQGNDEEDTVTFEELVDQELDPTQVDNPVLDDDEPEYNSDVEPSASAPPKGPGIRPQDYVWCEKKWVHKQSICRLIITPDFTPKSQVRLLRVRGFTSVNKKVNDAEVGNVLRGSYFITGDLFITLMRTPNKIVTLALVRATAISENGVPRACINLATLTSPRSNVKVTGEVLIILPSSSDHPTTDSSLRWIWNGSYLKHVSPVPGTDRTTLKVVTVSVAGHLLKTINPTIVDAFQHLTHDQAAEVNSKGTTWALSEDALHLAISLLWKEITDSNTPVNVLPALSFESAHFPYRAHNGSAALICNAGTELLMASGRGKTVTSKCPLCDESTKDLRSHMGIHILRASRNIPEVLINQLDGKLPCGFCGQSDNPDCAVTIKETARKTEVECKCPRKESYQYGSANKGSDNRPCRNVPIVCKLCVHKNRDTDWRPGVWRYNFEAHIDQEHPEYAHPGRPHGRHLPFAVWESHVALTGAEERKAGVPLRPPFLLVVEKENAPLASGSSRIQKRKSDGQTFASAASLAKRVRR